VIPLAGCTTVAVLADRAWSEPPLLSVAAESDAYQLRLTQGHAGVAAGDSGLVALYGVLGLPLLMAGMASVIGPVPADIARPLIAADLVFAALLGLVLPGPIGTTGEALEVETPRGADRRPLAADASGRLIAELPASGYRSGGTRSLHLVRKGYRMASWRLPRALPGVPVSSGSMPLLQLSLQQGTPSVGVGVALVAGASVRDLALSVEGTVPGSTAAWGVRPSRVDRLDQGQDVSFELLGPTPAGAASGRTRAWVMASEHLGWSSEGLAVPLEPSVADPPDRPWPVVLEALVFQDWPQGRRAELVLGLSAPEEQGWDSLRLTLRTGDPTVVFEQPVIDLGPVMLPSGRSPVFRTGLWRMAGKGGPVGIRLELEARRAGLAKTWFEDYWWPDDRN